jgi:quercetin dioxygenase-like cupin family protein
MMVRMRNAIWMVLLAAAPVVAPLLAENTAGVKFDTPEVKVIEAINPPGQRSALHKHEVNRVMIYLDDGHMELTTPDGKIEQVRWNAGDVRWSPAGGPHISENAGNTTYRIVEVELKNGPGAVPENALDPVRVDPDRYKVEFENPQVRVLRVRYGPKETGVLHQHILNRVTVLLSDENMRVATPDGKVTLVRGAEGETALGGPAKHQEQNLSLLPFEVVVVELKR